MAGKSNKIIFLLTIIQISLFCGANASEVRNPECDGFVSEDWYEGTLYRKYRCPQNASSPTLRPCTSSYTFNYYKEAKICKECFDAQLYFADGIATGGYYGAYFLKYFRPAGFNGWVEDYTNLQPVTRHKIPAILEKLKELINETTFQPNVNYTIIVKGLLWEPEREWEVVKADQDFPINCTSTMGLDNAGKQKQCLWISACHKKSE